MSELFALIVILAFGALIYHQNSPEDRGSAAKEAGVVQMVTERFTPASTPINNK